MSVMDYSDLLKHVGHKIVCTYYTDKDERGKPIMPPQNVAVECEDCYEVLLDFDRPEED